MADQPVSLSHTFSSLYAKCWWFVMHPLRKVSLGTKHCNLWLSLGTKTMSTSLVRAWWCFKCDTRTLVSWMKVVWHSTPLGTSLHHLFVIWHCCRWLYLAGTLNPCVSLPPHISTPKVYLYLGETQGAVKNINISWAKDKKGLLLSSN